MFAQLPIVDLTQHGLSDHDCPWTLGLGLFLFQALVFAALSSYVAVHRGHSAWSWFMAGFFGSFVGFFFSLRLRKIRQRFASPPFGKTAVTHAAIPCPRCQRENHPSASQCGQCGHLLSPSVSSEAAGVFD